MMMDYIDSITADDWMILILRCPTCLNPLRIDKKKQELSCTLNGVAHIQGLYSIRDGIPLFNTLPLNKREYYFEMNRYNRIALQPPETYDGYADSMPDERDAILTPLLKHHGGYLNIGQGFGHLEERMPHTPKICLDQCIEFLQYCKNKEISNTRYVMGFGEQMPFQDNYFPAVVSDSVFQTVVDQREFLVENARVLKPGGGFVLTVTYRWNYPRKPQDFPADRPELILHFLDELGVEVTYKYLDIKTGKHEFYEDGDLLLFEGHKRK